MSWLTSIVSKIDGALGIEEDPSSLFNSSKKAHTGDDPSAKFQLIDTSTPDDNDRVEDQDEEEGQNHADGHLGEHDDVDNITSDFEEDDDPGSQDHQPRRRGDGNGDGVSVDALRTEGRASRRSTSSSDRLSKRGSRERPSRVADKFDSWDDVPASSRTDVAVQEGPSVSEGTASPSSSPSRQHSPELASTQLASSASAVEEVEAQSEDPLRAQDPVMEAAPLSERPSVAAEAVDQSEANGNDEDDGHEDDGHEDDPKTLAATNDSDSATDATSDTKREQQPSLLGADHDADVETEASDGSQAGSHAEKPAPSTLRNDANECKGEEEVEISGRECAVSNVGGVSEETRTRDRAAAAEMEWKNKYDDLQGKHRSVSLKFVQLKMKYDAMTSERQKLREEHNQLVRALQQQVKGNSKQAIIDELQQEGNELNEKLMKSMRANANLKSQLKAFEEQLSAKTKTIAAGNTRISELQEALAQAKKAEKRMKQDSQQSASLVSKQSAEVETLKGENAALCVKIEDLQSELSKARSDADALEKEKALLSEKLKVSAQQANLAAKLDIETQLQEKTKMIQLLKNEHAEEVEGLRAAHASLERQSQATAQQRDAYIAELQERIQVAEERAQGLALTQSQSRQPLLNQIESLQASLSDQRTSMELVISQLHEQLAETTGRAEKFERLQRDAKLELMQATGSKRSLEESLNVVRADLQRLKAQVEQANKRESDTLMKLKASQSQYTSLVQKHEESMQAWSAERLQMTMQVDELREKSALLQKQVSAHLRHATPSSRTGRSNNSNSNSNSGSNAVSHHDNGSPRRPSPPGSAEMSRMTSLAELLVTRTDDDRNSRSNDNASDRGALFSVDGGEPEIDWHAMRDAHIELQHRHAQLLQMYGQKDEELQSLETDLRDVKNMAKLQVQTLVEQLEAATKSSSSSSSSST